jgi:EmrB/QacA subfamily drug resistance transporter
VLGIDDRTRKWWILAAMSGVLGLIVLDETVVGVALATIQPELAMSQVESHWVVNAYLLTFTCFVAVGGRLGDVLGHRGFFVTGVAIFGLASLAAGLAPSGAWLIAARGLQGIGAAVVFPASWAMMTSIFPAEQRGTAFGIQVTVGGLFMSMGPLLGGLFTETLSWRWIFWINLPVVAVIAAIVWSAWKAPPAECRGPSKIDWPGLFSLVGGLTALVTGLMQGAEWGWGAPATLALLCAGVVLLALFIVWERRTAHPLIQLGLLRDATFTGGILVFFMFQFNKIAVFVFIALYLQDALGFSPIDAGLVVMLAVVPTLVTSLLSGRAADRFGSRRPLFIGLSLNGAALILVALATTVHSVALLMAPLVVWGAMLPFIAVSARRALMSAVPKAQQGEASGVNLTVQMLGGTVGMALCSALLVATGTYWSLFLMTGALVFALLVVAWFTVERPAVSGP